MYHGFRLLKLFYSTLFRHDKVADIILIRGRRASSVKNSKRKLKIYAIRNKHHYNWYNYRCRFKI